MASKGTKRKKKPPPPKKKSPPPKKNTEKVKKKRNRPSRSYSSAGRFSSRRFSTQSDGEAQVPPPLLLANTEHPQLHLFRVFHWGHLLEQGENPEEIGSNHGDTHTSQEHNATTVKIGPT
ncbi:hypothetical protein Bca4012_014934 [Brassica carinata]